MSLETDRLAREAEDRRSSLDATLDSLKGKLSPGQMVDEFMTYAREGQGAEMLHNLNRQVRDNPLALGLIGAGAAWLLLGQGARSSSHGHDTGRSPERYPSSLGDGTGTNGVVTRTGSQADASPGLADRARSAGGAVADSTRSVASGLADRVSGAAGAVSSGASAASDSATRLTHDARDALAHAGSSTYRSASHLGDQASSYGRYAQRSLLDTLQKEPLILGAVALAVGAAIGAALPSTRVEDELMGEARDRLRDDALERGRDMAGAVETAATKAYEAGSAEAENKGLKPSDGSGETIAEKVSSVAKAAAGAAKEELRPDDTSSSKERPAN
ncbi:hypothetical protein NS226_16285 [Aureimonas ureilytica]|uniref:DUF3618 domain-containing protein n=1 Tax=Aureimonas ureilytica TaxID=401562 RepID=A0A175R5A9_9HYPH|nr:DUF3618 domain-containing protein [Aureimonas ureilytica]KTQ90079.1 hypothetical protein NS226_16285 [Aureimonas ureilytica]